MAAREEELVQRKPLVVDAREQDGEDEHVPSSYHTVKKWDGTWERVRLFDLSPPELIFRILNPRNPQKARRRLGHIYWKATKRFVMSFNLLFFGTTFLIISLVCFGTCNEIDRAWAFLLVGSLMFIPGIYSFCILVFYLRCDYGYSWKLLSEPS
eukprot:TRINITY_DN9806_c0_g1_i1.p1 TRINITY_DN9806_c0_g1~~TRINITY_DN9806_c0_g1_i1.p1  ORF type:complete len:177 (+),score=43.37 TRINITY_DN9806_c0_g1_i1:71-532(+)